MRRIVPGEILHLAEGDWKYGHGTLSMRVDRIREDISGYYEGAWVWVEGYELGPDGTPLYRLQALIRTAAGSAPDTTAAPDALPRAGAAGEADAPEPAAAGGESAADGVPDRAGEDGAGDGGTALSQPDSAR